MEVNLTTYESTKEENVYLQGKYITDILELRENLLLVASYSDCSYYLVDLETKQESLLCKGHSPYAMGLIKFPDYQFEKGHLGNQFPYVLAKEDDYLTVIHVRAGFSLRLAHVPTHNQNHFNQRLTFCGGDGKTFVTDESSYYLSKYRLNDILFKYLHEIDMWAQVNKLYKI